ncbi:putative serine/threonine-protein kinase-like protein CCR3 [Typha angustifolia]|uniref:putative serine/threonine-protein kinase-like protein CCR3 n=1 Tax=Typha angustifolia TaxID=59011 RepID=UPI003C3040DD
MNAPVTAAVAVTAVLVLLFAVSDATGSAATLAITHGAGTTVCGVAAGTAPRTVYCTAVSASLAGPTNPLLPNASSFASVSGGRDFLCGLRSDGAAFFCWRSSDLIPKRVYSGRATLADLAVGEDQISAVDLNATAIRWWRGGRRFPSYVSGTYRSLTSGNGFSCAISGNATVRCWGPRGDGIQTAFANLSMGSIVAGDSHVCGLDTAGILLCKGSNESGQSNAPSSSAFEFSSLALGSSHTCAIRQPNGTVVCWGGGNGSSGVYLPFNSTAFEFIVSGGNLTCGLTTVNFSVVCWGLNGGNSSNTLLLSLPRILPGICAADEHSCNCGVYPDSQSLCSGSGVICSRCGLGGPSPSPPASPPSSTSKRVGKGWVAFGAVGAVGGFAGVCTIVYCLWIGVCRQKKIHNSVQPTLAATAGNGASNGANSGAGPKVSRLPSPFTSPSGSRSRIFRRQSSRIMMRQRSGPSSFKDRAEEFTFADLAAATNSFSLDTKIGAGSFGTVYKGNLPDGRQVAIKRSEPGPRAKKFQEKESAFQSELAFLSRLHHKHLVGFVGYCEEKQERLLVYEYMNNGALYDHLHSKDTNFDSPVLNSWKVRIKVLLDAARGIEYLHNYAVPPIIHRDIKSSNILLDSNWVARVSDFGLSLMGPESEDSHLSMKAAGTVGYMDPEYYGLHHLTVKSDVYGFGVVILEVLTGKRAIFKEEEGGTPASVVDYAVPSIVAGEVDKMLDQRLERPGAREAEAVELVAYTAVHCVRLEGRERPVMSDVVANLETALALCDDSHGSISSASQSLTSVD